MSPFQDYETFWTRLNVSRETVSRLEHFVSILLERQKRDNLFSRGEQQDIWVRHVIDSAQLSLYIPTSEKRVADFGSGNGFPGIVLSILRPELLVFLIEKLEKKASFLSSVVSALGLNARVHKVAFSSLEPIHCQVLTARALAPLSPLLTELQPFVNKATTLILPKGRRWEEEVVAAQAEWEFSFEAHESLTSAQARILVIQDLIHK